MPRTLALVLARLNRWPRRLAALACLLLALLSAAAAGGRPSAPSGGSAASTRVVVVAAHDLGAGATLERPDLTTAAWPAELVPAGTSGQPNQLVGRRLASPVHKREAVTTTRLVGSDLTAALAHGQVATVVSTDAGFASVIHAGDRVDVLAGPPGSAAPVDSTVAAGGPSGRAVLVAEGVTVLAVLLPTDGAGGQYSAQVVVATDRSTALRIVWLRGRQVLAVAAGPP